jgi:hypothetical protein
MPNILFPNVPNVAGVPALLRKVSNVGTAVAGAIAVVEKFGSLSNFLAPRWGVYDASLNPVAIADSFLGVDYRNDSRISDYPVEQGAFASYNKVATPYEARVRLSCGKDEASRTAFLAAIDVAAKSTNLYSVVTPEATYLSANITNYDYRREVHNGAGLIVVELSLREIRQIAKAAYSSSGAAPIDSSQTSSVGAASPYNFGQVQATAPTSTQSALFGPNTVV